MTPYSAVLNQNVSEGHNNSPNCTYTLNMMIRNYLILLTRLFSLVNFVSYKMGAAVPYFYLYCILLKLIW